MGGELLTEGGAGSVRIFAAYPVPSLSFSGDIHRHRDQQKIGHAGPIARTRLGATGKWHSERVSKIGVAQTVFLVNRVFVPYQKGSFWRNGENDKFAFYPLKTRASLHRPLKTTKMAGVTQAKTWFRKSRACSSLIRGCWETPERCIPWPLLQYKAQGYIYICWTVGLGTTFDPL